MMPGPETTPRRFIIARNRGGFLLGSTWVHATSWTWRTVHFYLGFWVASVTWKTRRGWE